jgi:hypothetical protein
MSLVSRAFQTPEVIGEDEFQKVGTCHNTGSTMLPAGQKVFERLDHQYSFGPSLPSHERRVVNLLLSSRVVTFNVILER